jgi:hypothetical protein
MHKRAQLEGQKKVAFIAILAVLPLCIRHVLAVRGFFSSAVTNGMPLTLR